MRGKRIAVLCGIGILISATPLFAPQPGRPQNPEAFSRPKPLCSVESAEVRPTVQFLVQVLARRGFTPVQTLWEDGEAQFVKADGDAEDRVIVWIEWELRHPSERFNVFLSCGHFEKFFGTTELKRVVINAAEDQQRFGPLRNAIIADALARG